MANKVQARIPSGLRDILPVDMLRREYVLGVVREVFELYGFEPLQTSAIELTETLTGKYGEEGERLMYRAWYGDQPGGELSLRYDLSVPLSRVVAMHPELPRPFKRYQIAPVWRADRPAKGRYREFYQCDIDTVGPASMLADAEVLAVAYTLLNRLGFTQFTIEINNRKVLEGIGQFAGVPETLLPGLYRSIDKLDKIGLDGVRNELLMVGVPGEIMPPLQKIARLGIQGKIALDGLVDRMAAPADQGGEALAPALAQALEGPLRAEVEAAIAANHPSGELQAVTRDLVMRLGSPLRAYYAAQAEVIPDEVVDRLLDLLQITGPTEQVLAELAGSLQGYPRALEGLQELQELHQALGALGVPESCYAIRFAMVRGLEYYTGPIFEITVTEPKSMPSITGGGRYDKLIGLFAEQSYPAVGISFGIERIIDTMDELNMFPPDIRRSTAEVLVTVFSAEMAAHSLALSQQLRAEGIRVTLWYEPGTRLGEQIGYASTKGIPCVVILGPEEYSAGEATLRRLGATREQSQETRVALARLPQAIRSELSG